MSERSLTIGDGTVGFTDEFVDSMRVLLGLEAFNTSSTIRESLAAKTPCGFLVNGACSVYDARPIACRSHLSMDPRGEQACLDALSDLTRVMRPDMMEFLAPLIAAINDSGAMFPFVDVNAMMTEYLLSRCET